MLYINKKNQIQTIKQTQPSLPIKPKHTNTITHKYKHNNNNTLFNTLNILNKTIINQYIPQQQHKKFLIFLQQLKQKSTNPYKYI